MGQSTFNTEKEAAAVALEAPTSSTAPATPSAPTRSPRKGRGPPQLLNRQGFTGGSSGRITNTSTEKANRNMSTPDPIVESTAVQRLVEYFIVLSSVPRWEKDENHKHHEDSSPSAKKQRRRIFRRDRTKIGTSLPETAPLPPLPDPAPTLQDTGPCKTEGNIHLPEETFDYTFVPKITARYPTKDHSDNPLNPMITHFCFPTGDVIVPMESYELPRVHHFVLTNDRGRKVYGTCLTILEEYFPEEHDPWAHQSLIDGEKMGLDGMEVSVDDQRKALYLPKVLCLLSTWPYLTAFREYMAQLYRLATATNVMTAPVERYIVNLCAEVPAPPPGAYEIHVHILDSTIRFWAPPAKLPIAYVALPFHVLFECLDLEHIMRVWSALITERKVLLVSSQYSVLTVVCEILCSLLFPMRWSHLYIPLVPRMLCPMLGAPVPYLCGVVRENWLHAEENLAEDTVVVDLDKNRVSFGKDTIPVPQPPIRRWNKLRTRLEDSVGSLFWKVRGLEAEYHLKLAHIKPHKRSLRQLRLLPVPDYLVKRQASSDQAFNMAHTPHSNIMDSWSEEDALNATGQTRWDMVQEAFLRFFVDIFKKYRKYLVVPLPGRPSSMDRPSFDHVSFLATQPSQAVPFLTEVCVTQQFADWITRRLYYPGEPDLVFFDQSIDDKLNRSKLKIKKKETLFLHSARAQKVLTTLHAVAPDTNDLPRDTTAPFMYEKWPRTFSERLFSKPRPIPKMIAAEFDRQEILVERLRAEREIDDDNEADDLLQEEDFDSLPEVAAFTVFFFVYSALVGLDWQAYEAKRRQVAQQQLAEDGHTEDEDSQAADKSQEIVLSQQSPAPLIYVQPFHHKDCSSCPEESAAMFSFFGEGAGTAFQSLYLETTKRMEELRQMLDPTIASEKHENVEGAVEEYEEAVEAALAQLDLGFEVLKALSSRGLPADMDAFRSLMDACGRCRNTQRALELTKLMKEQELASDSEILSLFVSAFAAGVQDELDVAEFESPREEEEKKYDDVKRVSTKTRRSSSVLVKDPFPWLMSSANDEKFASSDDSCSFDDSVASPESSASSFGFSGLGHWLGQDRPKRSKARRRKRKKSKKLERSNSTRYRPVSSFVKAQVELAENLLDYLYPELKIDTSSDACPHCSYRLTESEIVLGWVPRDFQDYTTKCPKCQHRFVPNFSVSCACPDFEGSQGKQSVLFCELLSPWVLRKALGHVINGETGILGMLDPQWRSGTDIRATLFWNLIVLCRRYHLPFGFLLQGSVQGRIILPRPPQEL